MTSAHPTHPRGLAVAYVDAWQRGDESTLRGILDPDVDFAGPLGIATGVDECISGLLGMRRILERIDVSARAVDGDDVITWFDLHTTIAEPAPTANWMRISDGRIASIRVTFDPRSILAAGR